MICPVCEHPQETGATCEVCGRRLVAPAMADAGQVAPLEGLERTAFDVTAAPATAEGGWIEQHVAAPAEVEPIQPMEVERATGGPRHRIGGRAPPPAVCRYCRTPASPNAAFCERCGMKLDVYR